MKKVVYADANEELFRACSGRMTFLIENTRNIKEASSASVTKEMCEQFKPDKDHFACLQIALGDYETYGHNRNADSFPKEPRAAKQPNPLYTLQIHAAVRKTHTNCEQMSVPGAFAFESFPRISH